MIPQRTGVFLLLGAGVLASWLLAPGPGLAQNSTLQQNLLRQLAQPAAQIDLAQVLWTVSRDWDPRVDPKTLQPRLESLIESFQKQRTPDASPEQTVALLRRVIHQEGGYAFSEQVDSRGIPLNPEELFLHGLLQTRRGYCMNLSLLYLILGDRLNLPLKGVPLPNHFFVRYDDGKVRINIETTQGGAPFSDSFYVERFLGGRTEGADYYLNNLDKKQTLGAYFSNVGMILHRARRTRDALFYLKQSVRLNPAALDARNNLANLYSDLKQYDDAIREYRKALEWNPNNWQTYFNLGIAYAESGREPEALEAFRQAAQINPAYPPVHQVLARMYQQKGDWYGALAHLKALVKLQPRNLGPRLQIAHSYLRLDQPELALEYLQETQRLFPLALDINELMAEAHFRLKQYPAAEAQLKHILTQNPDAQHAYMQLGWIYFLQDQLDEAVNWTQKGLKAGNQPRMTLLGRMNLGLFHLVQGKVKEAEAWYLKALASRDPETVEDIVKDLKETAARFPEKPELEFYQGWAFLKAGKTDQARQQLKQFLRTHPQGPLAERARTLLAEAGGGSGKPPEGMVRVPAGFFIMGSDHHGADEAPRHQVYLNAYDIDETEVSAAQFAEFLNTVRDPKKLKDYFKPGKHATIRYDGRRFTPVPEAGDYPANQVTWYGADAFCRWRDKRLPTEAEWEKAARGEDGRTYPWGNSAPSPDRARYMQTWTEVIGHRVMMPVRSMPPGRSPYGLYHMAGNVKEWVDDWYDREYYKDESHKVNPMGPIGGEFKVLKGGSWRDLKSFLYASFRNNSYPKTGLDDYGFRCARSVETPPAPGKLTQSPLRARKVLWPGRD